MNLLRNSLALVATAILTMSTASAIEPNLKNGLAIQGYDPVSYFHGSPTKGESSLSQKHNGATYRFANEKNRSTFASNPAKYVPAVGGYCAWAMLESDAVKINPQSYKIIDGKLHLYYDGLLGDTLAKWTELAKKETDTALSRKSIANWSKLKR